MAISQILPLTFCLPATGFSNYDAARMPEKKARRPRLVQRLSLAYVSSYNKRPVYSMVPLR